MSFHIQLGKKDRKMKFPKTKLCETGRVEPIGKVNIKYEVFSAFLVFMVSIKTQLKWLGHLLNYKSSKQKKNPFVCRPFLKYQNYLRNQSTALVLLFSLIFVKISKPAKIKSFWALFNLN
jgi:hypothetical protein